MTSALTIVVSNAIISAALALVTVIVTRFWRSPQLAHGLWLLVLLKLVTPPLVSVSPPASWLAQRPGTTDSFPLPTTAAANTTIGPEFVHSPESDLETKPPAVASGIEHTQLPPAIVLSDPRTPPNDRTEVGSAIDTAAADYAESVVLPSRWPIAVAVVWLAGAIVYVTILVRRCIGFSRVLAASTAAGAEITESMRRLAAKLGLRRRLRVRMVEATLPPLVWSLGLRPVVVLPTRLLAELSPQERDALLAHELAHVRRRDDLVRWLEVIVLGAFWWNPVAWFARRKLREAEEECCDAWVVWALPAARRAYGEAMLATIEFLTDGPKLPALAGSNFGGSFYKRRIEMILNRNVNCRISWLALSMIALLAVAVLPVLAQTTQSDKTQTAAQPSDAAAASGAGAKADTSIAEDAGNSSDAVSIGSSDDDKEGGIAASTAKDDGNSVESREALLQRIKRLEELHQAEEPLQKGRRGVGGSAPSTTASPRFPDFNVSPDEREQRLQEQLLNLDVETAKSEIEQAQIEWQKSTQANKKQPGTVSEIEIARLRASVRAKEIQLQRAETILELFKRQVERKRAEIARVHGDAARPEEQRTFVETAKNRQLVETKRRAARADELARLKELNKRIADELARLEILLKEAPDAPETWRTVDEFFKAYRDLTGQRSVSDSNLQRYPGGVSN
jgi:beta-lactamase regulating signal transducer with metallopeptidase domain